MGVALQAEAEVEAGEADGDDDQPSAESVGAAGG